MMSVQKSLSRSEDEDQNFATNDCLNTVKNFHRKLDQSNNDNRCDRFGNVILQGAKDHHICFCDEIGEGPVEQVKEVECLKIYNKEHTYTSCTCIIIKMINSSIYYD